MLYYVSHCVYELCCLTINNGLEHTIIQFVNQPSSVKIHLDQTTQKHVFKRKRNSLT